MADSGTARSVSGEMMAGRRDVVRASAEPAGMPAGDWAAHDVIDADYIEVSPEPQISISHARTPRAAPRKPAGLAFLQRGNGRSQAGGTRGGPLFWLAGVVAVVAAFWVAGGHSALGPGLVAAISAQEPDLRIDNVRSSTGTVEGEDALVVDGEIRNDGKLSGKVPALAVTVLSQGGETAVYRLGTLRTPLAPGAKYSFSGRLLMPKDGVKTVSVAFDD
ncbi:MAG: hypothetical protein IT533_02440 [Hyphomicrobiales bacterium]|jgi:hypothetical protein|nr:hypothetical protein [Hyphomicrobiales bacterium]